MTGATIFFGLFTLVGLVVAAFGALTVARAHWSRSWPSVMGAIRSAKLALATRDQQGRSYKPLITYAYVVNGAEFSNDLISYGLGYYSGSREFAAGYIARYPVGQSVKVFYRPSAPGNSVLETGISARSFIPLLFGLVFAVAGFSFFLFLLHR